MRAKAFTKPGKKPAAKRPPIEILATTPIIIKSIEGGTIVAVPPAAASKAVAKGAGYFRFNISGIVIEPIAAVSALAEPQTPEKNIVPKTTTMPKPPRTRPTRTKDMFTIRPAIPPWPIIVPAKIKSGIANKVNESMPLRIFCGKVTKNSGEMMNKPTEVAIPKEIAIGTDAIRQISNTARTSTPMLIV